LFAANPHRFMSSPYHIRVPESAAVGKGLNHTVWTSEVNCKPLSIWLTAESPGTGTLITVDESIMAIIKQIDSEKNEYIIMELDSERCLVKEEKLPELQRKLKEVRWAKN